MILNNGRGVTYAPETWVLKENMINKLMIFERKVMRKIFCPRRSDDGYWRIKSHQEINDILKGQNVIGFIKKQRLNWLGRVERMAEYNNVQKIQRWKSMSKRLIGRPKTRWEDDVLEDIRSMNVRNWKKLTQDRDSWKKAVEQAKTLGCSAYKKKGRGYSTSTCRFDIEAYIWLCVCNSEDIMFFTLNRYVTGNKKEKWGPVNVISFRDDFHLYCDQRFPRKGSLRI